MNLKSLDFNPCRGRYCGVHGHGMVDMRPPYRDNGGENTVHYFSQRTDT